MDPADRTYRDQVVRIVDLATTRDVLDELVFDACEIVGPAVLIPLSSQFRGCILEEPAALWPIESGRYYIGAIGVRNCLFENCVFRRIGLAGDDEFLRAFLEDAGQADPDVPGA
jgi:hypothetical protein